MNIRNTSVGAVGQAMSKTLFKQFSFPSPTRGLAEAAMFAGVFLAAGYVSLDQSIGQMLVPMVLFVLVMMLCMVASGVYRNEITHSIINMYVHTAYGFFLATFALLITVEFIMPAYTDTRFVFFFLFFGFFVINTIRPLISGTDFMDGGGRRTN